MSASPPAEPPGIHPAALYVAGLLSPMSLLDQRWAYYGAWYIINCAAVIGFGLGYYMSSFRYCLYVVGAALALCHAVFLLNWRQRADPSVKWVPEAKVAAYYDLMERCVDEQCPASVGRQPVRAVRAQVAAAADEKAKTE
jgi:hypothetical protein